MNCSDEETHRIVFEVAARGEQVCSRTCSKLHIFHIRILLYMHDTLNNCESFARAAHVVNSYCRQLVKPPVGDTVTVVMQSENFWPHGVHCKVTGVVVFR